MIREVVHAERLKLLIVRDNLMVGLPRTQLMVAGIHPSGFCEDRVIVSESTYFFSSQSAATKDMTSHCSAVFLPRTAATDRGTEKAG